MYSVTFYCITLPPPWELELRCLHESEPHYDSAWWNSLKSWTQECDETPPKVCLYLALTHGWSSMIKKNPKKTHQALKCLSNHTPDKSSCTEEPGEEGRGQRVLTMTPSVALGRLAAEIEWERDRQEECVKHAALSLPCGWTPTELSPALGLPLAFPPPFPLSVVLLFCHSPDLLTPAQLSVCSLAWRLTRKKRSIHRYTDEGSTLTFFQVPFSIWVLSANHSANSYAYILTVAELFSPFSPASVRVCWHSHSVACGSLHSWEGEALQTVTTHTYAHYTITDPFVLAENKQKLCLSLSPIFSFTQRRHFQLNTLTNSVQLEQ